MSAGEYRSRSQIARLVRLCLEEGACVDIDGLGTFRRNPEGNYEFLARNRPRVFLAYVEEDAARIRQLYTSLKGRGFDPWMDKEKLLAGQNWPRAIERAIERADFFVACFSRRAEGKRGFFQSELRYALDCAARLPLEEVFFIPVRLEECEVPIPIRRSIQYVDLFPDWNQGVERVIATLRQDSGSRERSRLAG